MGTVRISEIANELGYNSKEVLGKAIELGLKVKTHQEHFRRPDADAAHRSQLGDNVGVCHRLPVMRN